MPEPLESWWRRRQFSSGRVVPYEVGRYRDDWARYPVLVRQYHPDLNSGVVLSQVPPAAEVYLQWQCDAGHVFVATPAEQRSRPGRERRRSVWCPECAELAKPRAPRPRPAGAPDAAIAADAAKVREPPRRPPPSARSVCVKTPPLAPGEPFTSECAPATASSAEAELRTRLAEHLEFDATHNAVRVQRAFFDHLEVWPDIVLGDLRVAIEYDSTGRHGLEHVGRREHIDVRKDRMLRQTGWEVIRIRTGRLQALGAHDLVVAGISRSTVSAIIERLRDIRGDLIVSSYLRQ